MSNLTNTYKHFIYLTKQQYKTPKVKKHLPNLDKFDYQDVPLYILTHPKYSLWLRNYLKLMKRSIYYTEYTDDDAFRYIVLNGVPSLYNFSP